MMTWNPGGAKMKQIPGERFSVEVIYNEEWRQSAAGLMLSFGGEIKQDEGY